MEATKKDKLDDAILALRDGWATKTPEEKTNEIEKIMVLQKAGEFSIHAALILSFAIDPENSLQTIKNKYPEYKPLIDNLTNRSHKRSRHKSREKSHNLSGEA
jgi:hypothetical protein